MSTSNTEVEIERIDISKEVLGIFSHHKMIRDPSQRVMIKQLKQCDEIKDFETIRYEKNTLEKVQ